jgi:hypothetical protein
MGRPLQGMTPLSFLQYDCTTCGEGIACQCLVKSREREHGKNQRKLFLPCLYARGGGGCTVSIEMTLFRAFFVHGV